MQKILGSLKNLNKDIFKIMKYGLIFSFLICLLSVFILLLYIFIGMNFLYYLGLVLMKSAFTFAVEFIICGFIVDFIKNKDF